MREIWLFHVQKPKDMGLSGKHDLLFTNTTEREGGTSTLTLNEDHHVKGRPTEDEQMGGRHEHKPLWHDWNGRHHIPIGQERTLRVLEDEACQLPNP